MGYAATPRLCLGAIRSSKIIFCDTGSQLAVLTLLNFFILFLITENTLQDSSHASVGVLTWL